MDWRVALLVTTALVLRAADPLFESAEHKLDLIELRQAKPGSTVVFTAAEINAWGRIKVLELIPEGIRMPRVELGEGTAAGYALVDFLKMRHARGDTTNWFVARLIQGERPLKVDVRIHSAAGQCTVDLTRVEVGSVVARDTVLDFLVKTFFLPLYPDARINEPFDLDYNIERIDVRPAGVRVTIKGR
jgi:hypothetical protein